MNKLKILTVDDDPDILDLLCVTLEDEFDVVQASTGKEAFDKINSERPDVLILDYMLPDTVGTRICEVLRKNPMFLHLPVLMLTGKGETEDKVKGLGAGADDYMVKPFSPQELIARVQMLIRRSTISLDANPLTRLPGNVSINKELEKRLSEEERFAVLYLDLDNFKAMNDHYGFKRGDEVIKKFSRILIDTIQQLGGVNEFIGHIGGDDFVIITSCENAEEFATKIISEFDKAAPEFYNEEDRMRGFIETKDRAGQLQKFRFVTVSIGIISTQQRQFTHVAELSTVGAELKELAKKIPESNYIIDRRTPSEETPPQKEKTQ